MLSGVPLCESDRTYRQQKTPTEEALCKRAVHRVLVIQKGRQFGVSLVVNQLDFSIAQFRPGTKGYAYLISGVLESQMRYR